MATACAECRLAGFLLTAILIQVTELAFHVWIVYFLYSSGSVIWCAVCSSIIASSTIASQIISFQLRRKENAEADRSRSFILCHVMLLGLFWRYYRLARCCHLSVTRYEVWQCYAVDCFVVFTRSFPMLLITVYLIMAEDLNAIMLYRRWFLMAAAAVSAVAIVRTLIVYKKRRHICCVVGAVTTSGGLVWKAPWRVGEVLARTLSGAAFASVHGYWTLLVLCLHWITVTLILIIDHVKGKALRCLFVSSYVHVFVGFDVTSGRSRLVAVLYSVLSCAESLTLTTLWLVYESRKEVRVPVSAVIAGCQVLAIVCAIGYHSFLFRKPDAVANDDDDVIYFQCVTCRTSEKATKGLRRRARGVSVPEAASRSPPDVSDRTADGDANDVIVTSHDLPVRHIKRLHGTSARSACTSCTCIPESGDPLNQSGTAYGDPDLSWDNYDITSHSDMTDASSHTQRLNTELGHLDLTNPLSGRTRARSGSSSKQHDPGYSSGISSSSSSKEAGTGLDQSEIQKNGKHIPLFPNTCDGYWSDDGSSTIASLSSRVCFVSTDDRQRHDVIRTRDSLSSSVTFSTSVTCTSEQRYDRITDIRLPVTRICHGRCQQRGDNHSGYNIDTPSSDRIHKISTDKEVPNSSFSYC